MTTVSTNDGDRCHDITCGYQDFIYLLWFDSKPFSKLFFGPYEIFI
jgi:hypothetical protein